jgi:hypothetical protein
LLKSSLSKIFPLFSFQFKEDVDYFLKMYRTPRPGVSWVKVMGAHEFKTSDDGRIQHILRDFHILVCGEDVPSYSFDRTGLETLGCLEAPITIHGITFSNHVNLFSDLGLPDLSIPFDPDHPDTRHSMGTLEDFLKSAQSNTGKSLNGLDFPKSFETPERKPFASDIVAWKLTKRLAFAKSSDEYPISAVRWGLCATSGAYHKCHIDCNGFGTFISPATGVKIWFLAAPKDPNSFEAFADMDLYLEDYDLDGTNETLWDWEPVVLKPGMTLYVLFDLSEYSSTINSA